MHGEEEEHIFVVRLVHPRLLEALLDGLHVRVREVERHAVHLQLVGRLVGWFVDWY